MSIQPKCRRHERKWQDFSFLLGKFCLCQFKFGFMKYKTVLFLTWIKMKGIKCYEFENDFLWLRTICWITVITFTKDFMKCKAEWAQMKWTLFPFPKPCWLRLVLPCKISSINSVVNSSIYVLQYTVYSIQYTFQLIDFFALVCEGSNDVFRLIGIPLFLIKSISGKNWMK